MRWCRICPDTRAGTPEVSKSDSGLGAKEGTYTEVRALSHSQRSLKRSISREGVEDRCRERKGMTMHKLGSSERPDWPLAVVVGAGGLGMAVARRLGLSHRIPLAPTATAIMPKPSAPAAPSSGRQSAPHGAGDLTTAPRMPASHRAIEQGDSK